MGKHTVHMYTMIVIKRICLGVGSVHTSMASTKGIPSGETTINREKVDQPGGHCREGSMGELGLIR